MNMCFSEWSEVSVEGGRVGSWEPIDRVGENQTTHSYVVALPTMGGYLVDFFFQSLSCIMMGGTWKGETHSGRIIPEHRRWGKQNEAF